MASLEALNDYSVVGIVLKSFGVFGEVKVQPQSSNLNRFRTLKRVCFFSPKNEFICEKRIESARESQGFWYFKFEGITQPEQVPEFRQCLLAVPLKERPKLPPGEYYVNDLIGFDVVDENQNVLGKVLEILDYPSCQTFLMKLKGKEVLAPWVDACISQINTEAKTVEIYVDFLKDTYSHL